MLDFLVSDGAKSFVAKFESIFRGLPHLPKGLTDFLVTIVPWVAGLGGAATIFRAVSMFDIDDFVDQLVDLDPIAITVIIQAATGALLLLAFSPLNKKELKGWMYLFWTSAIGVVELALLVVLYEFDLSSVLAGSAVGILVRFYLLFEIKPAYR